MPSHTPSALTMASKLVMILTFLFVTLPLTILRFLFWEVTGTKPQWSHRVKFFAATIKSAEPISFETRRGLIATTGDTIARYCRLYNHDHVPVPVPIDNGTAPDATLHFIDCKPEDKGPVLLFLHGGGYCYGPGVGAQGGGHCELAVQCARSCKLPKLAMLEYNLAPDTQYPGQMIQAVEALRYLLTLHSADQIVIVGDSAGGNLALAALVHLVRPSAQVAALDLKGAKLRGAALVSPWVGLNHTTPSYERNHKRDYLPVKEAQMYRQFWNPVLDEVWADPLLLPEPELRRLPVSNILITGGTWEMLCDDIALLGTKLGVPVDSQLIADGKTWHGYYVIGESGPVSYLESKGAPGMRVEVVLAEKEPHAMPTIDSLLGCKGGVTTQALREWCERLAGDRGEPLGDDVLV